MNLTKLSLILIFCIILSNIVYASPTTPVSEQTIIDNSDFLIENWNDLSFKHQKSDENWIKTYVNPELNPKGLNWNWIPAIIDEGYAMKCLSYAASTIADWYSLETGYALPVYTNILNGREERGHNPREMEQIYFDRTSISDPKYDFLWGGIVDDFLVTHEEVPYDIEGYMDLITDPPTNWFQRVDSELNNPNEFNYTVEPNEYFINFKYKPITANNTEVEKHLEQYGILYAHLPSQRYFNILPIHAVALIGYGSISGDRVFWIHDSYDEDYPSSDSKYKSVEVENIYRIFALYDPQWSMAHHDIHRTGVTLLKGDISTADDVDDMDITLSVNLSKGSVARSSIGDLDGNDKQEVVVASLKPDTGTGEPREGYLFSVEFQDESTIIEKWNYDLGVSMEGAPSLVNIDGDSMKEVIVAAKNKTVALDVNSAGDTASFKWEYENPERYSAEYGDVVRGESAHTLVVDIDLDGDQEIIFADNIDSLADWPGRVMVLDKNGNLEYSYTIGNGGGWGAISAANVDGDDYPELIVNSYYGVYVLDYNTSINNLSKKWNNGDGKLEGSSVVYDIDSDNEYELIYSSATRLCHATKTCQKMLYIVDALTGDYEKNISLSKIALVNPVVTQLDSDDSKEIVLVVRNSVVSTDRSGQVLSYDASSGNQDWYYDDGGTLKTSIIAPSVADIDGDNEYNILFTSFNDTIMYVLKETGSKLFDYSFSGPIGSSLAVGDLDGDAMAEIAVKHAGSPVTIVSVLSGFNKAPILNNISNISVIQNALINLNSSGEIWATDSNNDSLTFYYDWPFNESGLWQTTKNDAGNYLIVVEVTDGNLSDWQTVYVEVNDTLDPNITNQINYTDNQVSYIFSTEVDEDVFCTLWGDWTGTWEQNETTYIPVEGFNFTEVRTPGDGSTYTWGTNCTDLSGKHIWGENISFETRDVGQLNLNWVTPTTNAEHSQYELKPYKFQVSCIGGNCSNVTILLDPKLDPIKTPKERPTYIDETKTERTIEYTFTPNERTECYYNGTCLRIIYPITRFGYEDNEWKEVTDMASLKGTNIKCNVENDGIHNVECLDWNFTHRKLKYNIDTSELSKISPDLTAPVRILNNDNEELSRIDKDFYLYNYQTEWIKADFTDKIHVGEHSSNITLSDVLVTGFIKYVNGAYDSLDASPTYLSTGSTWDGNYNWYRSFIKYNISMIPATSSIDYVKYSIATQAISGSGTDVDACLIDDIGSSLDSSDWSAAIRGTCGSPLGYSDSLNTYYYNEFSTSDVNLSEGWVAVKMKGNFEDDYNSGDETLYSIYPTTHGTYPPIFLISYTPPDLTAPGISNQINYTNDRQTYYFSAESNESGQCTLFGDFYGSWQQNETIDVSLNQAFNFTSHILADNGTTYNWGLNCSDNSGNEAWGTNISFTTIANKHTVTNIIGAEPFYHNGTHEEYQCGEMFDGDICEVTFWANATYTLDTTHEFYGIADSDDLGVFTVESSRFNITIVSDAAPSIYNQKNYTNNGLTYTFSGALDETGQCSLWGNWSGSWTLNESQVVTATTSFNFTDITFAEDNNYIWGMNCSNNDGNEVWGNNLYFRCLRIHDFPELRYHYHF